MIALVFAMVLLQAPAVPPPPSVQSPAGSSVPGASPSSGVERNPVDLSGVVRIYVESFGTDETSKQMEAMLISSFTGSKRFIITEVKSKADAVLKGSVTQKSSQEVHAYGSATNVGTAAGSHSGSISGSHGSISGSSVGGFVANHAGIDDSSVNTETINDSQCAVRLVNSDGDVIWTTTQESKGAKYKGAGADVADKIVKQLLRDVDKRQSKPTTPIVATQPKSS